MLNVMRAGYRIPCEPAFSDLAQANSKTKLEQNEVRDKRLGRDFRLAANNLAITTCAQNRQVPIIIAAPRGVKYLALE
jgi:hypothetical protein